MTADSPNTPSWHAAGFTTRDRLSHLAGSVNDTARLIRVNLSLTLLVGLYLALTLLSTTDENLLRNAVVTLPQFETGISLKLSYIFAPMIFLYLHLQTLFLLPVLRRKLNSFEEALDVAFSSTDLSQKTECCNWLSASMFVQRFQYTGKLASIANVLTWLAMAGIPLSLLFLIDVSFMRFQSAAVSTIHHVCFSVDLMGVWYFGRLIDPHAVAIPWRDFRSILRNLVAAARRTTLDLGNLWKSCKQLGRAACAIVVTCVLWIYAWPPVYEYKFHDATSTVEREWYKDTLDFNLFDDLLCDFFPWRGFCRNIHIRDRTLLRTASAVEGISLLDKQNEKDVEILRRQHGINLIGRSLRFANFENSYFPLAQLAGADFSGASLESAVANGTDFTRATLNGVNLSNAKLNGAKFLWAEMYHTDLRWAELRGANLARAEANGASMQHSDLQGANLVWTQLNATNVYRADFSEADIILTDLNGAWVNEAILHQAKLNDVSFVGSRGTPVLNDETVLKDIKWKIEDLRAYSCKAGEDKIDCYVRGFPVEVREPTGLHMTLQELLRKYDKRNGKKPEWISTP